MSKANNTIWVCSCKPPGNEYWTLLENVGYATSERRIRLMAKGYFLNMGLLWPFIKCGDRRTTFNGRRVRFTRYTPYKKGE